ncbi:MAG: hypothetical protein AAF291_17275 [Pseudomonadota bacterium]
MVQGMAVEIKSREELEAWLSDKPREWAQIIAIRIALRVLPADLDPKFWVSKHDHGYYALGLFRALIVAFASVGYRNDTISREAARWAAIEFPHGHGPSTAAKFSAFASCHDSTKPAIGELIDAIRYADMTVNEASHSQGSRHQAVRMNALELAEEDGKALLEHGNPAEALASELWSNELGWRVESWTRVRKWLSASEDVFDVWREWYHGRLQGLPRAFKNFDGASDEAFYRWIAEQNNDWWSREPREVNADIKAKVEELRKPSPPSDAELEQEPRALLFRGNEVNQVALSDQTSATALLSDSEARDRHLLTKQLASAALAASHRDLTQAFDVGGLLKSYLEALGREPSEIRASNLVAFGGFLRNQVRNREASSKPPFTEDQQEALDQWRVAHNMLVAAHSYLASLERKGRDADLPEKVLNRDVTQSIIEDGRENGALHESAANALVQISEAVIARNDPDDSQNLTWMDSLRNSIRAAAAIIKANPLKAAAGVASGTAAGVYQLATWVQKHADALRQMFADEPSMLAIIEWISRLLL